MVLLDFSSCGALRPLIGSRDFTIEREVATLGLAIDAAVAYLDVEIVPFRGDRYFAAWRRASVKPQQLHPVLDIHVAREKAVVCPRHDLQFPLRSGDTVQFLGLIC